MLKVTCAQLETLLGRMDMELKLTKANKGVLDEHVTWPRAKNSNSRTVLKHLYSLVKFFEALNKEVTAS